MLKENQFVKYIISQISSGGTKHTTIQNTYILHLNTFGFKFLESL